MTHTHEDLGLGVYLKPKARPLTARAHLKPSVTRQSARKEEHLPMYRLWASVISQAILDIREGSKALNHEPVGRGTESAKSYQRRRERWKESIRAYDDAKAWIEGQNQGGLTFPDMCTALNLRPEAILSKLNKEIHA